MCGWACVRVIKHRMYARKPEVMISLRIRIHVYTYTCRTWGRDHCCWFFRTLLTKSETENPKPSSAAFLDVWKQIFDQLPSMAIALNQSLTPTKLSSHTPLSPSNYPDKRSMVAAYKRMVSERASWLAAVLTTVGCKAPFLRLALIYGCIQATPTIYTLI